MIKAGSIVRAIERDVYYWQHIGIIEGSSSENPYCPNFIKDCFIVRFVFQGRHVSSVVAEKWLEFIK